MGFKIGDRVIYDGKMWQKPNGKRATVVALPEASGGGYGIETDEEIDGHNCNGHAKRGHGWWVLEFEGKTKVLHHLEEEIDMECDEDIDALLF